jgi:hypothetical protein
MSMEIAGHLQDGQDSDSEATKQTTRPLAQNSRPGQAPLDRKGYEQAGGYRALRREQGGF